MCSPIGVVMGVEAEVVVVAVSTPAARDKAAASDIDEERRRSS